MIQTLNVAFTVDAEVLLAAGDRGVDLLNAHIRTAIFHAVEQIYEKGAYTVTRRELPDRMATEYRLQFKIDVPE